MIKITIVAKIKQNKPAIATVVNFGVSFLHLNDTENTEIIAGYNKAKNKASNSGDSIDAKIVEEVNDDSPENVLSS